MTDNVLATIPGEHIARATASLPDAATAPDEPHQVVIALNGRRIVLTFNRFKHKRGKTTRWFSTADSATLIE